MQAQSIPKFLLPPKGVTVIGAGFGHGDYGDGPDAVRKAGLKTSVEGLGWRVEDVGNLTISEPVKKSADVDESKYYKEEDINDSLKVGKQCERIFEEVKKAAESRNFVLTLGGDHGITCGTIAGMLAVHPDLCVIKIDAYAGCNTPCISQSKGYYGMAAAHLMGWFLKKAVGFDFLDSGGVGGNPVRLDEERVAVVGLRDLDDRERNRIKASKMTAVCMSEIDHKSISKTISDVVANIDPHDLRPIHLSFDLNACDPAIAPALGNNLKGGLTFREVHYLAEFLAATGRLVSMDFVEINASQDVVDEIQHGDDHTVPADTGVTVRLALDIIWSALGKVIL